MSDIDRLFGDAAERLSKTVARGIRRRLLIPVRWTCGHRYIDASVDRGNQDRRANTWTQ
ncbi:hypothetical protein KUF59_05770 [Bradyrhizobium arachidis]|nr:hypothetical protein KUF59_05770 [Bradyrhizobium arachidis]